MKLSSLATLCLFFCLVVSARAGQQEWNRLAEAVRDSDLATAQKLIAAGVDLKRTEEGASWTVLHWWNFSFDRLNIEILKLLLANGADVNAVDINGRTSLHFFLTPGDDQPVPTVEAVRIFVEAGANLDIKDEEGVSCRELGLKHEIPEIRSYFQSLSNNSPQRRGG